jgi:putative tryptophan/tyrosine transport system substrate-binding protein
MKRRVFIKIVGGVAAWPLAARAQQPDRTRLIGVLMGWESEPAARSLVAAFGGALSKLGWKEDKNLRIELRWGLGDPDRIGAFAKELVELRPDAILGVTTPVVGALARETRTIPIVFALVSDPIGSGFAASLAQPDRNITGFSDFNAALGGKWMALLKEIAPRIVRVALLLNPATGPPLQSFMPSIQEAASSYGIQVSVASVYAPDELEGVIAEQARSQGGSLIVLPAAFNVANRDRITALVARYGLPAIYNSNLYTEEGGLIAYGVDFIELFRQSGGYVDRILRGAKPGELPIQLPTRFSLVINLKTAKALGLTVPPTLLATADGVIE